MGKWSSSIVAALVVAAVGGLGGDNGASASPVPRPPELWVMDADGSDQRRLSPEGGPPAYSPTWSPSGSEIAYIAAGELRVVTLSTGATRTVVTNMPSTDIAWSPDGNWIAIATYSGTPRGLFLVRPDGTALHQVGPDLQASHPKWSPDGLRVAVTLAVGPGLPFQIAVIDLLGDHQIVASDASFTRTAWAPDGTRLAYADHTGRLGIVTLGGTTSKITSGDEFAFSPDWSPDGAKIAYAEGGLVAAINPDGSGRIELAPGGSPEWSPDGDALAISDHSAASDIYSVGRDASALTNLTNTDERLDEDPVWSPTGSSIAYLSAPKTPVPPDETIASTISLRIREHVVYRGRVEAPAGSICSFQQRRVRIEQRRPWGWDVVARTRTEGSRGRFEVELRDREGRFRASVKELVTYGPGGNQVTCTAARSEVVGHRH